MFAIFAEDKSDFETEFKLEARDLMGVLNFLKMVLNQFERYLKSQVLGNLLFVMMLIHVVISKKHQRFMKR